MMKEIQKRLLVKKVVGFDKCIMPKIVKSKRHNYVIRMDCGSFQAFRLKELLNL